jgi:prepilin-type N-terminal cleavage/methylation domain-containing protein
MKLKNFGLKKGGFTLIELLVVIVIIGILATIGIASFNGYFAKARDTERQAALRNMSTIMQAARATEVVSEYNDMDLVATTTTAPTAALIGSFMVAQGGYSVPDGKSGHSYYYVYGGTNDQEFAFFACREGDATAAPFAQGTSAGVTDVLGTASIACSTMAEGLTTAAYQTASGTYTLVEFSADPN